MIATVRIAPIERWCPAATEELVRHPLMAELVGHVVQIETERVIPSGLEDCGGRMWETTESTRKLFETAVPSFGTGNLEYYPWICEHVLEMD